MLVVEFSLSQKVFHKQGLNEMMKGNLESTLMRRQTDYIPIGLFHTNEQADAFIKKNYQLFKNYGMFKTTEGSTFVVEES